MKNFYVDGKIFNEQKELVDKVERRIESETMYDRKKIEYMLIKITTYERDEDDEKGEGTMIRALYLINKKSKGITNNQYIRLLYEEQYNDKIDIQMNTVELSKEEIDSMYDSWYY